MARTGRFGRLPRAAPALGSVIAALQREMAAQQDRNMVDAWREGGLYEGKKVTDDMLVNHFKKRRDAISPSDPLWDTYNTLVQNYEFAIADSKMTLKYANHEVNEAQMAQHYTDWANKLPTDSEAYRELMRSAAQFRDAANERGRAAAGASRAAAFKQGEQNIKDAKMKGYDDATNILTQAAIRYGILTDNMTGEPPSLYQMRVAEGDQGRFLELFQVIQTDQRYADIKMALASAGIDPNTFTYGTWLSMGQSYGQGLDQLMQNAANFGETEWVDKYASDKTMFNQALLFMGDADIQTVYNTAYKDLMKVAQDPTASPYEQDAAMDRYQRTLERLLGQATSDAVRGPLESELRALNGDTTSVGPTLWEGSQVADPATGDAATTAAQRQTNNSAINAVSQGRAVMIREPTTSGGQTLPVWTAIPVNQDMADPSKGMIVWSDVGAGRSAPRWVTFTPIISEGGRNIDPATGLPTEFPVPIGSQVIGQTFMLDGKRHYGILNDAGVLVWTPDNPFKPPPGSTTNVSYTSDENGYHVLWEIPPGTRTTTVGGVTTEGGAAYNPKDIVPGAFTDEDIPNDRRWVGDPKTMMYRTDKRTARAILRADPSVAHALIMTIYGDGLAGAAEWNNWQDDRNRLAVIADQYVTPREIAMRGGDSLMQSFGIGAARVTPDRPGTGEERFLTPERREEQYGLAVRQRAADMVTSALFVRPAVNPRAGTGGAGAAEAAERRFRQRQLTLTAGMTPDQIQAWVQRQTGENFMVPPPPGVNTGWRPGMGGGPPAPPRPPATTTIKPPPTLAVPLPPPPIPPPVHPVDLGEPIPRPAPPPSIDPVTGKPPRSGFQR